MYRHDVLLSSWIRSGFAFILFLKLTSGIIIRAFEDSRFLPITKRELKSLEVGYVLFPFLWGPPPSQHHHTLFLNRHFTASPSSPTSNPRRTHSTGKSARTASGSPFTTAAVATRPPTFRTSHSSKAGTRKKR